MTHVFTYRTNRPTEPDRTRPAIVLRYTIIDAGRQGQPPRYAMEAKCDDGEVRTFVVGPNVRKEE